MVVARVAVRLPRPIGCCIVKTNTAAIGPPPGGIEDSRPWRLVVPVRIVALDGVRSPRRLLHSYD